MLQQHVVPLGRVRCRAAPATTVGRLPAWAPCGVVRARGRSIASTSLLITARPAPVEPGAGASGPAQGPIVVQLQALPGVVAEPSRLVHPPTTTPRQRLRHRARQRLRPARQHLPRHRHQQRRARPSARKRSGSAAGPCTRSPSPSRPTDTCSCTSRGARPYESRCTRSQAGSSAPLCWTSSPSILSSASSAHT